MAYSLFDIGACNCSGVILCGCSGVPSTLKVSDTHVITSVTTLTYNGSTAWVGSFLFAFPGAGALGCVAEMVPISIFIIRAGCGLQYSWPIVGAAQCPTTALLGTSTGTFNWTPSAQTCSPFSQTWTSPVCGSTDFCVLCNAVSPTATVTT
jgi:hypothetical protein